MGSSPLTRGKRGSFTSCVYRAGLIPTHAGKTARGMWVVVRGWAHPHSRGENMDTFCVGVDFLGSSPLTRGKHLKIISFVFPLGLIPTHAGKTHKKYPYCEMSRAHPHSRGENTSSTLKHAQTAGSSPLTRGKQSVGCSGRNMRGLIPTHAGKTTLGFNCLSALKAHPHSRGEN